MRKLAVVLFLFSLSGCSALTPMTDAVGDLFSNSDNNEPPAELTEYQAEIKFDILWDESDGDGSNELALNLVPAIADERIIIADQGGLIQARNLKDGELLWEVETDLAISVGPVINQNLLFVGTSKA